MEYTAEDLAREKREEVIRETMDGMLFRQIEDAFGADAEEIIARIICGQSADSALQDLFER